MTDDELAAKRQTADDPVLLNQIAAATGMTVDQARSILLHHYDRLAELTPPQRDEFVAGMPVLLHAIERPPGHA